MTIATVKKICPLIILFPARNNNFDKRFFSGYAAEFAVLKEF